MPEPVKRRIQIDVEVDPARWSDDDLVTEEWDAHGWDADQHDQMDQFGVRVLGIRVVMGPVPPD